MSFEKLLIKAKKAYDKGQLNEALQLLLEGVKLNPSAEIYIEIALLYDELNNFAMAIAYFKKALEADSHNARGYYGLATIYDNLKAYDEAIAYYKEAIFYNALYFEAHFFLANIYDELEEIDLAIYHYEQVIVLNPVHFYAHLNLGSIYESLDKDELALEYFTKAEELETENHLLYFNFGVVYRKLGNINESIASYEKALMLKQDYPFTYLNLAIIYKDDLLNLTKALEIYNEGLNFNPEDAVLYYNRACIFALTGKDIKATNDLIKAVNLNPELKEYLFEDEELKDLRKTNFFKNSF